MPGTSPGWRGLGPSSLVMLVTLATTAVTLSDLSDDNKTIVRLDIGSVDQPANCSGFLDDLEVRWFLKIVHFLLKMWYSIMDDIEFSIWKLEMLCFPTTCENSWKWSPSRRCSADDDANLITAGQKLDPLCRNIDWLELSDGWFQDPWSHLSVMVFVLWTVDKRPMSTYCVPMWHSVLKDS